MEQFYRETVGPSASHLGITPQANDQVERANTEVGCLLQVYMQTTRSTGPSSYHGQNVSITSYMIQPCSNVSSNSSLGTPIPPTPLTLMSGSGGVNKFGRLQTNTWNKQPRCRRNLQTDHNAMPQFEPGERGWLSFSDVMHGYRKLTHCYIGPFKIQQWNNKVDLSHHCHLAPIFHVSKLKPVTPGPLAFNILPIHIPSSSRHWRTTSICSQIYPGFTMKTGIGAVPHRLGEFWTRKEVPGPNLWHFGFVYCHHTRSKSIYF